MLILLLMIWIMPLEANPYLKISNSFLGLFPDFTTIKLLGLLGLAWTVLEVMAGRVRIGLLKSRQARAFFFFLAITLFVGLAEGAVGKPLTRMISIVLFLPLVLAAVRTEADLRAALKAAALVFVVLFPYGYRQVLRFGGRFGVGLYEPNYLAVALVLMLPIAFIFARQQRVRWKKMLWLGGCAVLFLEVVLTGSRGGFIGLVAVLGLIAFRLARRPLLAATGMSFLAFCIVFVIPTTLGQRLRSTWQDDVQVAGADQSVQQRKELFLAGLRMAADNPLIGVGLGNFKSRVTEYGTNLDKLAHNTYLEIAAEQGLPALATFLYLLGATLASLKRSERRAAACGNRELGELALALRIGLVGGLVSAAFVSAQFEKFLWLGIFLTICMERVLSHQARVAARAADSGRLVWNPAVHSYVQRFG